MQGYIDYNQFMQQTGANPNELSQVGNQGNYQFGTQANQGSFQQSNYNNNLQQGSFGNKSGGYSQYTISPMRIQQLSQQIAQQSPQLMQNQYQNQYSNNLNQQRSLNTAQFQQQTGANPSEFATNIPVNFNQFRQATGQNMDGLSQFGQGMQNQYTQGVQNQFGQNQYNQGLQNQYGQNQTQF